MEIKKVVVPVAGWGTRSLPATKNVPKEMLPVYNKPVVQYVVEEAQGAGLTDVVFVTNRNKTIIEDHFDYNLALEDVLKRTNKMDTLKMVHDVAEMVNIISVRQKRQLGLGHAVLCAKAAVGNDPFALMVGDDLMFGMEPGIKQLMAVAHSEHMPVVGVVEVPSDKVSNYGIIRGDEFAPGMYRVRDLVEKPKVSEAPSRLAIVGRYILFPDIFEHLENLSPGHGGEIQLTDAMKELAKSNRLLAVKIRGQRFDTGDWSDYLTANIYFALQDETLRDDLVQRLKELLPYKG
ncbi:UTP--glucose-1-phosphate uridylyltransferase GalU [Desulfovibrio inopinatus]|uniref:UTP--glucose-1-phosphate uridylyltransferase GalU n=1 Tax=Desulfovibrio inopinatus TaxID=102109 RepID=UPI00040A5418|nr:UTP--glucose-1-phosphate uridylyltransferase GalU [Desulfovibrio inopinatus]